MFQFIQCVLCVVVAESCRHLWSRCDCYFCCIDQKTQMQTSQTICPRFAGWKANRASRPVGETINVWVMKVAMDEQGPDSAWKSECEGCWHPGELSGHQGILNMVWPGASLVWSSQLPSTFSTVPTCGCIWNSPGKRWKVKSPSFHARSLKPWGVC
jgi:hypothetical protein